MICLTNGCPHRYTTQARLELSVATMNMFEIQLQTTGRILRGLQHFVIV